MQSLTSRKNNHFISYLGVFSLSFGSAIGWGSFVLSGDNFLANAGPLGTSIGLAIGAFIMTIIGMNYHFLMNHDQDNGGAYAYAKKYTNQDHGFLVGFFLLVGYLAILWANMASVIRISRAICGSFFQFGFSYTIFSSGNTIYLGEILLEILVIVIFSLIVFKWKKLAIYLQIIFSIILLLGVFIIFFASLFSGTFSLAPLFAEGNEIRQVFNVLLMSPWAFIGFESVSHSAEEFSFPKKNIYKVLIASIVFGLVVFCFLHTFQ